MTKLRVRFLYTFYTLIAAVFFLYLLFPSQGVKDYIAAQVRHTWPDCRISIQDLHPALPPGISMENVRFSRENRELLRADQVRFMPKLSRMVRGDLTLRYFGNAYDGEFSGTIDFGEDNPQRPENVTLRLNRIQVQKDLLAHLDGAPEISGVLDGHLSWSQKRRAGETLGAKLTLSALTLSIPALGQDMEALTFSKLETDFTVERKNLNIRRGVFTGSQLDGSITGSIRIGTPVEKSRLNLRLTVLPHPEYMAKLKEMFPIIAFPKRGGGTGSYAFRIFGTIEKPSFSLTR